MVTRPDMGHSSGGKQGIKEIGQKIIEPERRKRYRMASRDLRETGQRETESIWRRWIKTERKPQISKSKVTKN